MASPISPTSTSIFSESTTSTDINGKTTGSRRTMSTTIDGSGKRVSTTVQKIGELPHEQVTYYDSDGKLLPGPPEPEQKRGSRILDVSDDADKQYEERMEDEYAKREGGA